MRQKIYFSLLAILFLLFFNQVETVCQVEFRIGLMPDSTTYRVYMKPSVTWASPFNITSSAQVTIKAPTGGFVVDNEIALVGGTSWSHNATYIAPIEDPAHDYFSFGMLSLATSAYNYQAGVEIAIIEFENTGICTGGVTLMEANDPFTPPNSQSGNVGNQITILGAGPGNAWVGNYNVGQANCLGATAVTCSVDDVVFVEPSDCGTTDGSINITATASAGVLEYSIDNGGTWQIGNLFTGLGQGNYTILTQTLGGGCSASYANNPLILNEPSAPVIDEVTTTDPSDCGNVDGEVSVTAIGGTGSYEYQLNNNGWGTASVFSNLPAGNYTVAVRNNDGTCTVSQNTTLAAPSAPMIASVSTIAPNACGVANGEITINVIGGTGSYEYSLNGTDWVPSNIFQNLADGSHDIFVRNNDGTCEIQGNAVSLNAPDALVVNAVSNAPSACGITDGSITVAALNGTGSYEYSIDNGGTWFPSGSFQNLGDGNYTVLAKNGDQSCETSYPNNPVTLNEPGCPGACSVEYILEQLPNGKYQVSILPHVTWSAPLNITSTAQVTVLAPAGSFIVDNLTNLVPMVEFSYNANYAAPVENPNQDYFVFGLTTQSTSGISYQQGVKVPLFTFENVGFCSGDNIYLMSNNDPFSPPNLQSANVGQQLTTLGSGPDADICVAEEGVPCVTPNVGESCMVAYQLELLPDGRYQVSLISDTTWLFPENTTSTAQVTIVAPAGGLVIDDFTNLIPGADFANNANYFSPTENPGKDYWAIGLTSNGTNSIPYVKGVKAPLFTFRNVGECTGDSIYLMPIEGDPFAVPNLQSANVGQQLTTQGSGQDANICIIGEGVLCVPCGPNMTDTDEDGICDNEELFGGSDPNDPCDPDLFSPACDFVCPEYFDADSLLWDLAAGPFQACVDIPFSEIAYYDIIVNQAPYTQPIGYCALDTLTFYSYAFTVGQGTFGPYEVVSWTVNGSVFSGLVPNMDALADSMNVWDPAGNWMHTAGFAAVSGGDDGTNYGNMTIKHVDSGVNTYIQPNITFIGADSKIEIDGVGEYELVLADSNGCSDTLVIHIYNPDNDTVNYSYPVDSSYLDICLETSELPAAGAYTTFICEGPANGTVSITGDGCLQYITDPEYNGFDTICVVVCSDTDPVFCDTTTVVLNVMQYICNDVFPTDTLYLLGENGQATYCAPLPISNLATYNILLDQTAYTLPTAPCAFDTLIFYTYAYTVGQGNDGPYEVVSWNANGTVHSGMVANMNGLAAMMNVWDPSGNWQNMEAFSAISGGGNSGNYGQMRLRHVGTNIPTIIQANYTLLGTHTELTINGIGWHELVIENEQTGCSDAIVINVVEPITETITTVLPQGKTTVDVCLETGELPGDPTNMFFCGQPDNGTAIITSPTCINYTPDNGFVGEDVFCVVICDDSSGEGPFCDTTYVTVIAPPTRGTMDIVMAPNDPAVVCLDDLLDFPGVLLSASICGEDPTEVGAAMDVNNCAILDPADGFVGDAEVCVVHCFESLISGTIVCDTNYINILVLPQTDTLYVNITSFDPLDTCLTDLIGLPGNLTTASICGENTDEVDAATISDECVSLTPTGGFLNGVSTVCVVHCDDRDPAVCDTTYIIVNVDIICPEIFEEDTIYITSPEVCIPIDLSEIDAYEIIVDGAPYTFPPASCANDIVTFYSYAFTYGAGAAGPYELVSWAVGGVVYSGVFQDIDALVAQMNVWDPNGLWENGNGSLSVSNSASGGDAEAIYGIMLLKHIGSGITTTLLPNFTTIANSTEINMPSPGLHELVVINRETQCPDTVYVWWFDVTTETITVTTDYGTPTDPICSDASQLPSNLTVSLCSNPQNGTVGQVSPGCFEFQPDNGFAGLEELCVVVCSDLTTPAGDAICDTTIVQVIVLPKTDLVEEETPMGEDIDVCLDNVLDIDGTIISAGVCNADPAEVNVTIDNSSCINVEPIGNFVGLSEICVYHCYSIAGNVVCDTTYLDLLVTPVKDTIYIDIEGFDPVSVCLLNEGVLHLSGAPESAVVCGENTDEVDATVNSSNDCVTLDPAEPFTGLSEVCVVHCDDGNPALCDTTIIIIDVSYPCEDIWTTDTIVSHSYQYCIPIEFSAVNIYEVLLNGEDYVYPPESCLEDSLVYYTYSFTIGAGAGGPYSISWDLEGNNHTTTVQNMDELTDWMNQTDMSGTWVNNAQTKSISNIDVYHGYGIMTVTQISSGVPAILQPNFTSIAFGSTIYFDEPGLQEVVVTNELTGCSDTVYVWYVDNATSTVTITVPHATSTDDYCLDADGLAGDLASVDFCGMPQNGTADLGGDCFSYAPVGNFAGTDQVCVVVCDDTPAPWGPFCDTTYFEITVEASDCEPLFGQTVFEVFTESGSNSGEFCLPINPQELNIYEVLVNNAPYAALPIGCDVETSVFYTYSFTVGGGGAGPYEISSWGIDGVVYSTVVQDMDELVDWMNQIDPGAGWQVDAGSFSIVGISTDNQVYGNMVVKHLGTQIPTILLPNFTEIAGGTAIELPVGTHHLQVNNLADGCVDSVTVIVTTDVEEVLVASRAFLQGAYTGGIMHDQLREKGYLPLLEPYTDYNPIGGVYNFIHTTGGGEITTPDVFTETGPDAIVDWVFLELRAGDDSVEVVATRSALVQRDGDIVDTDGFSPVSFSVPDGDYYFVVRHRSHLGIMTAAPFPLSDVVTVIDFTDPTTQTWGDHARRDMNDGFMAMWAGDPNANGNLTFQGANNDPDAIFFTVLLAPGNINASRDYIVNGYNPADTNMDGQVIYQGMNNDIDFMIFFNVLQNPENPDVLINKVIMEKLP